MTIQFLHRIRLAILTVYDGGFAGNDTMGAMTAPSERLMLLAEDLASHDRIAQLSSRP